MEGMPSYTRKALALNSLFMISQCSNRKLGGFPTVCTTCIALTWSRAGQFWQNASMGLHEIDATKVLQINKKCSS
jgi:hypothetical protein